MVDYFFSVVNKMNESHVRGRRIFHSTDLAEVLAGKTDLDLADLAKDAAPVPGTRMGEKQIARCC
jgi:hypothetical protein